MSSVKEINESLFNLSFSNEVKFSRSFFQMGRSSDFVTVKPEALVPEHLEFPRFNYKLVGQKNQFFYALGNDYLHPNRVKIL